MVRKILMLLGAVLSFANADGEEIFEFHRTRFGDNIDRASMSFLKVAYHLADDKNVVTSPLGVFTLLSLYAGGAGHRSVEEIVHVLGARNYAELSESYQALGASLSSVDPKFFTMINKIYLADGFTPNPVFLSLFKSRDEVEKISFVDPQAATAIINRWGEEKTRGHIKHPVPDGVIDYTTVMALFNVIFFQDEWLVPFDSKETKDGDFYMDNNQSIKKPIMHIAGELLYYHSKDIGAHLVDLEYKHKGLHMVMVVPDKLDGLYSVIEKVQKRGLLADIFKMNDDIEINFSMPKFDIESGFNLKELLPEIGINKVFEERANGIVREQGLVIDNAFQKAFIKVNEEGTTAGAFTGSGNRIFGGGITVRADHPFMFLILYEDKILFVGTYTH